MKRFLLLLLAAFVFQFSMAQTNTFPGTGNVGIGTTNPRLLLDVGADISNSTLGCVFGRIGEGNTTGEGTFLGVRGYSTQPTNVKSFAIEHSFYGYTNSSINFYRGGDMKGGFLTFSTDNNSEKMRITTGGNVGIGTTSPNAKLELKTTSTGTSALRLSSSAVGANSLNIVAMGTEETTGGGGRSNVASYLFQRASDGADIFQLDLTNRQSYFIGENVGIGTTSPFAKLAVVKGSTRIEMAPNGTGLGDVFRVWGLNGSAFTVNSVVTNSGKLITDLGINYAVNGDHGGLSYALIGTKKAPVLRLSAEDGSIALYGDNGTGSDYRMPTFNLGLYVQGDGKIGIGTTNTQGYQLAVNGDAIFTKVKVKTYTTWPDYVFHHSYKLRPLKDLADYIKQNNHLPDVPSANEVKKNGLDLGDNQALLLKKIEELTLYIIDQQKQIDDLKKLVQQGQNSTSISK